MSEVVMTETLWLLERDVVINGVNSYNEFLRTRRTDFYTGEGWGSSALMANRYCSEELAAQVMEREQDRLDRLFPYGGSNITLCVRGHVFGCGTADDAQQEYRP